MPYDPRKARKDCVSGGGIQMMKGDMDLKIRQGRKKIEDAIKLHHGSTILAAGITSMVPGITGIAAEAAGAKMLEISQNGIALLQGLHGVKNRTEARKVSYQIPMSDMAKHTRGLRNVVSDDVFITISVPGVWTHTAPTPFFEEHALLLSYAGADGLHVHKSTVEDYHGIADLAHKYGMLIDAYISEPPKNIDVHASSYSGVPAATPKDIEARVKELEDAGADTIGLLTGKTYMGMKAGEISPQMEERLLALKSSAKVPTMVEGGITPDNAGGFKKLGVQILVVGTAFDDVVKDAVIKFIQKILVPL